MKNGFPTKRKLFMWFPLKKKALTWDMLQKQLFIGLDCYLLCHNSTKSIVHLHCPFTQAIWKEICGLEGPYLLWNWDTIKDYLKTWIEEKHKPSLKSLPLIVCLGIWIEWNNTTFEDRDHSCIQVDL